MAMPRFLLRFLLRNLLLWLVAAPSMPRRPCSGR
jgi:hypothetical protein